MSKTDFIKQKLEEKGIEDYTEEDLKFLKLEMIEAIFAGKDKHQAFEKAFYTWTKRRKRNV